MAVVKPTLARGTRDFGPELMAKRKYIFGILEAAFRKYGFLPLETPAMENLSTLTGKYGEEGDRLIFKILNSGDYLHEVSQEQFDVAKANGSRSFTGLVSEKALRYDLTVPFARFAAMNRGNLHFPFKRYQMQPVWRADRPQKGRYREFYQCDADVIGSTSLQHEAELIALYVESFSNLGFRDFTIRVNNRKFFAPIAQKLGLTGGEQALAVPLDKLDKVGEEAVRAELLASGAIEEALDGFFSLLKHASEPAALELLCTWLGETSAAQARLEMQSVWHGLRGLQVDLSKVKFDMTLARGLDYYTGTIVEVVTHEVAMGSIGGGGRYDNLTGIFGVDGLSGVGISFGAERIMDVMEQLNLFPADIYNACEILFFHFSDAEFGHAAAAVAAMRKHGIGAEWFSEGNKLKKAFAYAEAKYIPYLAIIGEEEAKQGTVALKNLAAGTQETLTIDQLIQKFKSL